MLVDKIILASKSKFRQQLLKSGGLAADVQASGVDEDAYFGQSSRVTAVLRAIAKAQAVAAKYPQAVVIGADQTLALGDRAFTKANSIDEAFANLNELSGRTHHLFSAVAIVVSSTCGAEVEIEKFVVTVPMKMRILTEAEIVAYVALGEWQGCVGSYQAENAGANLFTEIGGDTTAVMGLPMTLLLARLRAIGINPLLNPHGPWSIDPHWEREVRSETGKNQLVSEV